MKITIPIFPSPLKGLRKCKETAENQTEHVLTEQSDFFIQEAYKSLRTNVTFSMLEESSTHVVVVTSALQSEGKSITSVNLAISYAALNCRVLLMDCDLRRPKLNRLLSVGRKVGLSNLLMNPDLRSKAVAETAWPNLQVILSGDIPPNPSELLASSRMKKLLQDLRGQYDYIILDTPPVNTVTDTCVLAPESNGVLFVVRAGMTERRSVALAVSQLEHAKAKLLGFVINDAGGERKGYGYRKYRYGYGYRPYESGGSAAEGTLAGSDRKQRVGET